ncbi:MAG TPA: divergent polysaccharide deacetylase family protein, partial [Stellaceae bacterium]|nr:divergent polysaccharide deacetylase family protein [Stellaceae bacterium]
PPPPSPPPRDRSTAQPLLPAPDPGLVETGPQGKLPIIGRDGRQPWRVYGRPFDRADPRPRIAVIITGVGPTGAATEAAIDSLPGPVTLAFDPYTRQLGEWVDQARAAGHEVLLGLPMEPVDYPRLDPGPYTLLTSLAPKDNLERLDWVLSRVSGYVGLTTVFGSRFTASQTNLLPVLDELKRRGLMFVDGRSSPQSVAPTLAQSMSLPCVVADDTIDADTSRDAIDRHLASLEALARQNHAALGIGFDYPVTLERVALWAKTLPEKGIALAPVTALPPLPGDAKGAAQ